MPTPQTEQTTPEVAPAPDTVPAYSWYALSVLVLIYILNFVDRQILSILANDIKADLNLSDADLGFLYGTAFAVFYALFGIPLGKLADSWHRVRLMTIGLALWSLMTAVSGFARNGAALTVARIGVGVGEATASPSAYSLISDYFPARLRATALAIYSSGLYIGGGISLLIGGLVVENWNAAFPDGGPLGMAGWQAAFVAVGLPGLLLAIWVLTLREPVRGEIDNMPTPSDPHPFRGFTNELFTVIPPFTIIGAARRGVGALALNLLTLAVVGLLGLFLTAWLGSGDGSFIKPISDQWLFLGVGYYSVFSFASALRTRDLPTFRLTWGSPAFLCTILGYGLVSFMSYASSYWSAPYAERVFEVSKADLGWWLGAPSALAGFLGVIGGGRVADYLYERYAAGRIYVVMFGLLAPIPAVLILYTTTNLVLFFVLAFVAQVLTASALGAAAAASQALVLPRMRGVATATFFLATTLVGLALGPYTAGYVSAANGDDLAKGVLATLWVTPIGFVLLVAAIKLVPEAGRSLIQRAKDAGETGL